jgi:riboflavin synthase
MFTGIVEEVGRVGAVTARGEIAVVAVEARAVVADLSVGDSIAVNGTCLTAVDVSPDGFTVELAPETLRRTSLGALAPGDPVNLERALTPASRMGGHFVQGHIDATGEVLAIDPEGEARLVRFAAPDAILRYIVPKGFVAIDGVSLTVVELSGGAFSVSYIPHTLAQTTAGAYRIGVRVNLEPDILGKYVEHMLAARLDSATISDPRVDHAVTTHARPSLEPIP